MILTFASACDKFQAHCLVNRFWYDLIHFNATSWYSLDMFSSKLPDYVKLHIPPSTFRCVRRLEIRVYDRLGTLFQVMPCLSAVPALHLIGHLSSFYTDIVSDMYSLQELVLTQGSLSVDFMQKMGRTCTQLQILKLEQCGWSPLDLTMLKDCASLHTLEIIGRDTTAAKWLTLPASSSLTQLTLLGSEKAKQEAPAGWCDSYHKLPNLKDLTLDPSVAGVPMFHAL